MPGQNPASHIMSHFLLELRECEDFPEPAEALRNLMKAGAGRHEAVHVLIGVQDSVIAEAAAEDTFVAESLMRGRMRFVADVAAAMADGTAGRLRPSRNDPCPCGSERKYKRCCGKDGQWPPFPMMPGTNHVPEHVLMGDDQGPRPGVTMLLDPGRYFGEDVIAALPQDHPAVRLENTARDAPMGAFPP